MSNTTWLRPWRNSISRVRSASRGRNLVLFVMSMGLIVSCGDGRSPTAKLPPPAPGTDKRICMDGAARKKKELGRPYPYNDGTYADAYLGDSFLKVPLAYGHSIDYGEYPEYGGQSVIMEAYLPDFKPYKPGAPIGPVPGEPGYKPNNVTIFLSCTPKKTLEEYISKVSRYTEESMARHETEGYPGLGYAIPKVEELPALGLRILPLGPKRYIPERGGLYFPMDPKFKRPNGGVFSFRCEGDPMSETKQPCFASFAVRPNIAVSYNFPYQWLDHWREIQGFVYKLVTTSIQE